MLTGDFIFKGTIGRIDWPGSNPEEMKNSLLLFKERYKEIDMPIYAGHNDATTIQKELMTNIFLLDPKNVKLL
jgi:glyoxylase-like metal-dependent hydrolase (beta-lactamase superfamily II)